ncbi:MAG: C1 family peptidase [archaeon]|nr:C1 family peptidase [archaeon]MEA3344052.1 C1 family peptidase [archaeon]
MSSAGACQACGGTQISGECSTGMCCKCSGGGGQKCSDGTPYGQCSSTPPNYCDNNGNLNGNCDKCDCPSGYTCEKGACVKGGGSGGTPTDKPDLIVADIKIFANGVEVFNPIAGRSYTIKAVIKNQESKDVTFENIPGEALTLYIDGEKFTRLGYTDLHQSTPDIASGQSRTYTFKDKWTPSTAKKYTLKVNVDKDNEIKEVREDNNERTEQITVVAPSNKPDLRVADIVWKPANPKVNDDVQFAVIIINQGDATADAFYVQLYIENEELCGTSCKVSHLNSEETTTVNPQYNSATLHKKFTSIGSYNIKAIVDYDDGVDESDDNNNEMKRILVINSVGGGEGGVPQGEEGRKCEDGTKHDTCSENLPKYCFDGYLRDLCIHCGCPTRHECSRRGDVCEPTLPIIDNIKRPNKAFESVEVTLTATAHDPYPDGRIVSYEWTENGKSLSNQATFSKVFHVGDHTITLTVANDAGVKAHEDIEFTVIEVNEGEVKALIDFPLEGEIYDKSKPIHFAGAGTRGKERVEVDYAWISNRDGFLSNEKSFEKKLAKGAHKITLTVEDNGEQATDSVTINVWPVCNYPCEPQCKLPEKFDWRNAGGTNWMTDARHKGDCGSCWAFSVIGAMEAVYNIEQQNADKDIDLSEQYLVSCSSAGSCDGGVLYKTLEYVKDSGTTDESCFKYKAEDSSCSDRCDTWKDRLWNIRSYGEVSTDEDELKRAVICRGPLAVARGSHGWVLVGYDDINEKWILKNCYGSGHGEKGYDLEWYSGAAYRICQAYYVEGVYPV